MMSFIIIICPIIIIIIIIIQTFEASLARVAATIFRQLVALFRFVVCCRFQWFVRQYRLRARSL